MASVNDWAAKCAEFILDEISENVQWRNRRLVTPSQERIAAIIATFAEPMLKLLYESRRHHQPPCHRVFDDDMTDVCTCGATEWNAKIDEALGGR